MWVCLGEGRLCQGGLWLWWGLGGSGLSLWRGLLGLLRRWLGL